MPNDKYKDESSDHKYFAIIPRLVWALSEDAYEFTLWCVIKDIAGEKGECILSTEALADLAMMSVGKVVSCRNKLLEKGLLEGNLYRDPGYPQSIWHISIPDLWRNNVHWAETHNTISDRIDYKSEQKKSLHLVKASPDEGGPSPGEGLPSSHEDSNNKDGREPSPGEAKKSIKNLKEKQKEEDNLKPKTNRSQTDWVKALIRMKNLMGIRGRQIFEEYFEPTYLDNREGNRFIIAVGSEEQRAWLTDRGKKEMENILVGVSNLPDPKIEFIVKGENHNG